MTSHPPGSGAGLQPERTLLAWRRTALSLGIACLAGARLTFDRHGAVPVAMGIVGLLLAAATYLVSTRRYRQILQSEGADRMPPAGLAAALLTATSLVIGLLGAVYVL